MSLFLNAICRDVWMMEDSLVESVLPFLRNALKAGNFTFPIQPESSRSYLTNNGTAIFPKSYNEAPEGSIAIHEIHGIITKFDQECGPRGTSSLMRTMKVADDSPKVGAHVLDIDSGGGQASMIETVAKFIRFEIKKPVLAIYNGACASAAIYLGAAADELYASKATDITGSIGTKIEWEDIKPYLIKQGVIVHNVRARKSKAKNQEFRTAEEKKDYSGIQDLFLDPYQQEFEAAIRLFRPNVSDEIFDGRTMMSEDAIKANLIDGIKTFNEVLARASELINIKNNGGVPAQNSTTMSNKTSYPKIQAVIAEFETTDKGVHFTLEQLQQIEDSIGLTEESTEIVEEVAATPVASTTEPNLLQEIQKLGKDLGARIDAQDSKIEKLGNSAGARPAGSKVKTDAKEAAGSNADDAISQFNQGVENSRKHGTSLHEVD